MDVETLVKPVVEASGLELVDVTFQREAGRRVLRVTIDRQGGVDLDTIAQTSERISRRLDLEGFTPGPYTLEVSSPGLERPLKRASDYTRELGRIVKIKTFEPVEGARNHRGVLRAADDASVTLDIDGNERTLPLGAIASARTVFEWGDR